MQEPASATVSLTPPPTHDSQAEGEPSEPRTPPLDFTMTVPVQRLRRSSAAYTALPHHGHDSPLLHSVLHRPCW
jgi:hypothetical protein